MGDGESLRVEEAEERNVLVSSVGPDLAVSAAPPPPSTQTDLPKQHLPSPLPHLFSNSPETKNADMRSQPGRPNPINKLNVSLETVHVLPAPSRPTNFKSPCKGICE